MLTLKILFWAMLLIVFYTYLGYGILLYLIIRLKRFFKGKPLKTVLPSDEELPTMTLMICAYNEEEVVAEKMANTLALNYPRDKFRIMWVTDGSNDRTNELLKAFAEKHPEITWIDFNDKMVDSTGWVPRTIMADEIHPTDAGYDFWMDAILPHLKK